MLFDIRKCIYCNFNKYAIPSNFDSLEDKVHQGMLTDFDYAMRNSRKKEIKSIYFGGGTPSLMKPKNLEELIERVIGSGSQPMEITLEVMP